MLRHFLTVPPTERMNRIGKKSDGRMNPALKNDNELTDNGLYSSKSLSKKAF